MLKLNDNYFILMVSGAIGYFICFIISEIYFTNLPNESIQDLITSANIAHTINYLSFFSVLGFMIGAIGTIYYLTKNPQESDEEE